jgi:hypothetical protein
MVADDPVVLFVFTTVCKGGVYLPVIVIDPKGERLLGGPDTGTELE